MRLLCAAVAVFAAASAACSAPPVGDPLQLEGNRLTVDNRTTDRWSDVEIWLNTYYRVTMPYIDAGGRFQVPLSSFVAAFGQRFDFKKTQITDLRLTAKRPDGTPFELKKKLEKGGLADALEGIGGKR